MKQMRYLFLLLLVSVSVSAQIDRKNQPLKLQLVTPIENQTENSTSAHPLNTKVFLIKKTIY